MSEQKVEALPHTHTHTLNICQLTTEQLCMKLRKKHSHGKGEKKKKKRLLCWELSGVSY